MRISKLSCSVLALVTAASFTSLSAQASDRPFTIRFGAALLEPTSDTTIMGTTHEFDQGYGPAFDFEWHFHPRLGLQGSGITAFDVDIDEDDDRSAGVSISPVTVGLNGHLIRNERFDWGVGVFGGAVFFSDFDHEDDTTTISTEDDTTVGARTFLDVAVGTSGKWGFGFAAEWFGMTFEPDGAPEIDVDPFVVRAMGVFRFGGP